MPESRARTTPRSDGDALWSGALFLFLFVAAVSTVKAAANGLFLASFTASRLPWMYVLVPPSVAVTLLIAMVVPPRVRLSAGLGGAAVALAGLFILQPAYPSAVSMALYLFGEAMATTLSVVFWEELGALVDSRTAKRLFGPIAAFGMMGSVAGGLFVRYGSLAFGTRLLLPFAAGALALAMFAAGALRWSRGQEEILSARGGALDGVIGPKTWAAGLELVLTRRYPMLVATLTLLLSVLTVVVDFLFRAKAQSLLHDDALTSVFGSVSMVSGGISVLFQLFLSGYLLTRLDIGRYLMATTGAVAAVAMLGLAPLGFVPIYVLKVVETANSLSINLPAIQLLYHPLDPGKRVVLRSLIDGMVKKLGLALGGLGIIASLPLAEQMIHTMGALFVLPVAGLTLVVVWATRKEYVHLLEERVRLRHRHEGTMETVAARERGARATLERALTSRRETTVLAALELVRRDPSFELDRHLPALLSSPWPKVRRAALELVRHREDRPYFYMMSLVDAKRWGQPDPEEVRHAPATLEQEDATEYLTRLVIDDKADFEARSVAVEALYPDEPPDGPAHRKLEKWALFGRTFLGTRDRRTLVELIGRLEDPSLGSLLKPYLSDPSLEVRRAAVVAAGRLGPDMAPQLLDLLADRSVRYWVVKGLSRLGDAVVPALETWMNDKGKKLGPRLVIPRILRMIGTQRAAEALLYSNPDDDPFLRNRAAQEASRLRREHPEVTFDRERTVQAIARRIQSLGYYLPLYRDLLEAFQPVHLLMRLLDDRLRQSVDVVFRGLTLIHDPETFDAVRIRWMYGSRHQRAEALDLLEGEAEIPFKVRLVELLEDYEAMRVQGMVFSASPGKVGPEGCMSSDALRAWYTRGGLGDTGRGHAGSLLAAEVQRSGPVDGLDSVVELPSLGAARWLDRLAQLGRSKDLLLRVVAARTIEALGLDLPVDEVKEEDMPHQIIDRVLFLQSVDLFERQRVDDLVAIASISEEQDYPAGAQIYREGEPSDSLLVIMDGEVELTLGGKHVMALGPGESFGQLSMLDNKPRPVTATATTDCRILVIGRTGFFDLISDRSELMSGLVEVLVKRIRCLLGGEREAG